MCFWVMVEIHWRNVSTHFRPLPFPSLINARFDKDLLQKTIILNMNIQSIFLQFKTGRPRFARTAASYPPLVSARDPERKRLKKAFTDNLTSANLKGRTNINVFFPVSNPPRYICKFASQGRRPFPHSPSTHPPTCMRCQLNVKNRP